MGKFSVKNSQLKRQVRLNKPKEKELNSISRPSRCTSKSRLRRRAVPEMVFVLSMAGTLGREAGRLVEDVLSRCSAEGGKRHSEET